MTIDEEGFLSRDIQAWINRHRADNNEWFQLAEDMNRVGQRQLMALNVAAYDEQKLLQALLFMKGLFAFQAAIVLTERGMTKEACTLVRSCFETVFVLGALREDPAFVDDLICDNENNRKKLADALMSLPKSASGLDAAGTKKLTDFLAQLAQSGLKLQGIKIDQAAQKAKLKEVYDVFYRSLSGDAAHPTVNALSGYLGGDDKLKWGPAYADIEDTLVAACTAALFLITWTNEMFDEQVLQEDLERSAALHKELIEKKSRKDDVARRSSVSP